MNEYMVATALGLGIYIAWALAFLLNLIINLVWAWIDDSPLCRSLWLWNFLKKCFPSRWKYPVWNGDPDPQSVPFGYAKDPALNNSCVWKLEEGKDYMYNWRAKCNRALLVLLASGAVPIFILLVYKFLAVAISIASVILVAYLARFARRLSKKFAKHVEDKKVHRE